MPTRKRSSLQTNIFEAKRNALRTVKDIEHDVSRLELSLHQALASHIRQPSHRHQTLRTMRHLIIEQAITATSGIPMIAVFKWIVEGWGYRPSYDFYNGFLEYIEQAEEVCPERIEGIRKVRDEFREGIEPFLKGRLGFVLVEGPSTPERRKRSRPSLPPIPEEQSS